MTNEQKIAAIKELVTGLTATEMRDLEYYLEDAADEQAKIECSRDGHKMYDDHCGRPEHRFCGHCNERETTINARQAEVNEAADGNSAEPSASLGSRSI